MAEPAAPEAATAVSGGAEPVVRPHLPLAVVVAIACVAQLMVILDTTIVNVALPAMKQDLGLSASGQQWVVNGYLITFGGLLLLAGRAGDLFGRRGVFLAGLAVFTAASLAGGLAPGPGLLVAARFVQGAAAAVLAPSSLSLITASHPEGPARSRAMALWSATAVAGAAIGLVLGGVLVTELSWRYVLLVNVPIGVALFAVSAVALLPLPAARARQRLDVPGAVTVTAGTGALVYGISEATSRGWGSAPVIATLAAAVVLLAGFVVIESASTAPLVPLGIFRRRAISVANALMFLLGVLLTATLFFLSLYLQQVLGYSALRTGLAVLPQSVILIAASLNAPRLLRRLGAFPLALTGALLTAGGLAWLSRIPVHPAYASHVLGPVLLIGLGFGMVMLPVIATATAGMDAGQAGLASALANTSRQLGAAVGLSALVTIAATATSHSHLASPAAATVHGYRAAFAICAVAGLAAALLTLLLPRAARPAPTAPSDNSEASHT
jgi:EmrB/QacA subfamily drug resistance transporter